MAYGTVGKLHIKPGHIADVVAILNEWETDRKDKVDGVIAGYTLHPDLHQNTLIITAVFRDQKAYLKNADDPDQDKWFSRLAEHFSAEPEWNDGQIVSGA